MANYLLNAFSYQMIDSQSGVTKHEVVDKLPEGLVSAIGHPDTARVLGVEYNRINVKLNKGDVAYLAQLEGGRLPEGCTELPEGYKFKFLRLEIL